MLIYVINEKVVSNITRVIDNVSSRVDIVEVRLDYCDVIDYAAIKKIISMSCVPIIFTLRKNSQGGRFCGSSDEWLKIICDIASLNPDYMDIEYDIPLNYLKKIIKISPNTKIIISYHNVRETPSDIDSILSLIKKPFKVSYKIATHANTSIDLLNMMQFVARVSSNTDITGITMGRIGKPMRVVGTIVGNTFSYTSNDSDKALGHITLDELYDTYNYSYINSNTKIYALLGCPVDASYGHVYHNKCFKINMDNSVYIKIEIQPNELPQFFTKAKPLPFYGFSITMPLKQKVVPFVDVIEERSQLIQSVNTITCKDNKSYGFNTDGIAVMDLLEIMGKVEGKKILIIGSGGTSIAIVREALIRNAEVVIVNRTEYIAKKIAQLMGCCYGRLDDIKTFVKQGYDILINATSVGMNDNEAVIEEEDIIMGSVVVELVYPKTTKLLLLAYNRAKAIISGKDVFLEQAKLQQNLWRK
jgi:3-dehydroquinate dehydratase / shikimate dehydrogenase